MSTQINKRNSKPGLKSTESLQQLAKFKSYLTNNYNEEVSEKVFVEINRKLGIDVKGALQEFIIKKTFNWAFQSQLPFKIAHASFNLFRVGFYHVHAREGQAQEKTNPYSPKSEPQMYVDFLIWTWQNKKEPYYMVRSYSLN